MLRQSSGCCISPKVHKYEYLQIALRSKGLVSNMEMHTTFISNRDDSHGLRTEKRVISSLGIHFIAKAKGPPEEFIWP